MREMVRNRLEDTERKSNCPTDTSINQAQRKEVKLKVSEMPNGRMIMGGEQDSKRH